MSNSVDLVVVYTPVGGGHRAAAEATAEAARARGLRVAVLNAFDGAPRMACEAYVFAHLTGQSAAPCLYGHVYDAANKRGGAWEPIRHGFDHLVFGGLVERVRALGAKAVIATHHLPLVVLGRARRCGVLGASLLGVVTDYEAHAYWAEAGVDAWAVPRGFAGVDLVRHGVAPERVFETGIPVRAAFARACRNSPDARPVVRVLVTSGGFGHAPMLRIVRSFAGISGVELTVICGHAEALATQLAREAEALGVRAEVLGFERDMASRVAHAHVVVGKAGGLTVTEALTAGRPMVLAGAVPGNESANETFVVNGGAGVPARPFEVGAVVQRLRDARVLPRMGRRARRLVPRHAADAVVDLALRGHF
jgi:processive 1,2-diacylglycerol beta-glucosyltransferase